MPTYKDVEVWIEDSQHQKLNHQEVSIDLVDEQTMTVKIEMPKNESFTVHCLSPISVFCDVYVVTSSQVRKRAARFHLDKALAISDNALGSSSVDCAEGRFRSHGLRTPKRAIRKGKLGSVEVEIRRVNQIIKSEHREGCKTNEGGKIDFVMIDDFDQPPWLVFRFDIGVKASLAPFALTAADHIRRHGRSKIPMNRTQRTSSYPEGSKCLHRSKQRLRPNGSATIGANSDQLQKEYEQVEAEEQRLLQKLQEQLEAMKTRNIELRRMLGETA